MKRVKKHIPLWVVCLVLIFMATTATGQETKRSRNVTITGIVKDLENKKRLGYVHIVSQRNNLATMTNRNGKFTLKADSSCFPLTLELSHIGYRKYKIQIDTPQAKDLQIGMIPHPIMLDETIVLPNNARFIVEKAIENIVHNYPAKKCLMKGFYRETVQKKKRYINLSEAITNIYKTNYYTGSPSDDKVEIVKSRRIISHKPTDTLAVKLSGGPTLNIWLDIVKNPEILLNRKMLDGYHFTLTSPEIIDDKLTHVIRFQPNGYLPNALYEGKLYINPTNLSFVRAEFNLSLKNKAEATQTILTRKPMGLRFNLQEVSYIVSYREQNGKTVLNYVRNQIRFKCDWKRKLFGTSYTILSENLITDWEEISSTQLLPNKTFKQHKTIYDLAPANWDKDFWKEYNILEPEVSLEKAIQKLKKQKTSE